MLVGLVLLFSGPPVDGALVATVDDDGQARGHGAVHVRDGAAQTILVADGTAQASCGDADGDGEAGVTGLVIDLRDPRSGARLTAEAIAIDGDIEGRGRVKVRFPGFHGSDEDPIISAWLLVTPLDRSAGANS